MKIKLIPKLKKSLFFICFILLYVSCTAPKENKVLIIGIDGCKPDALLKAPTKNIDNLWKNGAYSFHAKTDEISSSGICWTSMLTGVWHDKHKVISNQYRNPNIKEYPHLFQRVKQFNPDLKTYSIVQWEPIHKILRDNDVDVAKSFKTDEEVTNDVVNIIQEYDVDVMFVQLDDIDHAGHDYDFDSNSVKYLNAIKKADGRVGRIVETLKGRDNYLNENWLIILSTDHGGSNYSHGLNIEEHTTIFYIVFGDDAHKGEIKDSVNVIDVCVTAMQHIGIPIKKEWNLEGKSIGLK